MAEDSAEGATGIKQAAEEDCSVCVTVHIRPLIDSELSEGCQPCLSVAPDQPQVFTGANSFTYDHVFGGAGLPEARLYDSCVLPLVEGLFKGYNATVFAYGQTGSGKTYTMGSAFTPGGNSRGVIPRVMDTVFSKIGATQDTDFTVRVGFVEIHTEEIRDLLLLDAHGGQAVHIREVPGGGICLAGATEKEVNSKEQMAELLSQGTLQRATASTNMNKHSSRSHAIFTITVEQRRKLPARVAERDSRSDAEEDGNESADEEIVDDYLCAKMHLVDLAGSERTKRTKAEGQRLKEGININKGLLALGNVISALSEGKSHVPYRDSKLTRMLQDSLGGNSRTVMIACVSPADVNLEESLNTLRYANRARNIKNKPVVNRDPNAAQLAHLRQQLAAARSEIGMLKRRLIQSSGQNGAAPWVDPDTASSDAVLASALDEMQLKLSATDLDNARLRVELETARQELREATAALIQAQAERDRNALRIERLLAGKGELAGQDDPLAEDPADLGVMQKHLQRILELEKEVKRLKKVQRASGAYMVSARKQGGRQPSLLSQESLPEPMSPLPMLDLNRVSSGLDADDPAADGAASSLAEDEEFAAEEHAHRVEQQKVATELENLQRVLASKEAQMARVMSGDGQIASLKKHYDRIFTELQGERDQLQKERTELMQRMQALWSTKEEDRTALEARYKQRLREMDVKLKDVAKKERKYSQIERLQARSQETCQRLQGDILAIKQQKVQLMKQMENSQKEFQQWRKQRERELMTLRRQGMKAAAHVQRLEALQAKQQAVLRRKTEEAEAARKRLKEMVEVHQRAGEARAQRPLQARSNGVEAQPNNTAPLLRDEKARREWVEHELDMSCQSFVIQRVLDGEKAERSESARQLQEVEKKLAGQPMGKQREALAAKKAALAEEIKKQSAQILETQQQLMRAKAEEDLKGQAAADAKRWNGLKTIVEARSLLKSVFKVAASQKAQLYEGQSEVAEMREETEMLRLKLEAAEQEAAEAKQAAIQAQSALAEALAAATPSPTPEQPATDEMDGVVESLMEEIQGAEQATKASPANAGPESETEPDYASAPESEESSGDEGDNLWDPQHATPWRPRIRRRSGGHHARPSASQAQLQNTVEEVEEQLKTMRDAHEYPVLMDINHERSRQGLTPVVKLTVPVLKAHLRGKTVRGGKWTMGAKKREDLIEDYRDYLGMRQREGSGLYLRANPVSAQHSSMLGSPQPPQNGGNRLHGPRATANPPGLPDLEPSNSGQHTASGRAFPSAEPFGRDMPSGNARMKVNPLTQGALDWRGSTPGSGHSQLSGIELTQMERKGSEGAQLTPYSSLPRLRTRLDQDSASEGGSPLVLEASDGQESTPTAKFYSAVKQQCQAAMKRAQALKEKMENQNPNAAAQPSPLRLPALQIPVNRETSPEGPADQSPEEEPGAGSSASENARLSPPSSPTRDGDRTGGLSQAAGSSGDSPGSPGRQLAGDPAQPNGALSPFSRRSYEKPSESARNRRNQPTMRSGGPLLARLPKTSLVSPRPRAAWL